MAPKHYIIIGRVSKDTGIKLVSRFGRENIIQSRYGTHPDGEPTFELFLDGALDDHPLEQNLSLEEKEKIREDLKGAHITIVHSVSGKNTSSRALSLMKSLRMLKKDSEVGSITVIAPHMALTRSDRKFKKEIEKDGIKIIVRQDNARGNEFMASALRAYGADRIIGVDFHSNDAKADYDRFFNSNYKMTNGFDELLEGMQEAGVKDKSIRELKKIYAKRCGQAAKINPLFPTDGVVFVSAVKPILVPHLKHIFNAADIFNLSIGAPDGANKPNDSGIGRARDANEGWLGYSDDTKMFFIAKERIGPDEVHVIPDLSHAEVKGKICILVDDIVNSGKTQMEAADYLRLQGADRIIAYATHAVLVGDNLRKMLEQDTIDELWVTDTVPGVIEKWEKLKVKLHREVREGKLTLEQRDNMVTKFTILPVSDIILSHVSQDHGARMKTLPGLIWASEKRCSKTLAQTAEMSPA